LLKAGSSLNQPLPQAVQELLQQVLPNEKLSPQAVKDLFRNSGLFFESNLLNNSQSGSDLKAALLKLVASLQSSSSQNTSLSQWLSAMGGREAVSRDPLALQERLLDALQKAAEGALAKLEIRQLHTLQQRDEGRLVWQLGLPIGQGDQVEEIDVAIKQQRRNAGSQEGGWSVDLHFDFDETGPMDVRLFLQDERVNAVFWATKAETLPKIEQLLPQLRSNLQRAGLEVEQLNAYRGQAPVAPQETPRPTGPLLDEKA
jgi:flagellar hook-length control protein FliK